MSWSSLVEDKLGAARRRVLRRVSASAPLGLLVRGVLALCAGAALSGVRLPGGSLPLGLALVAALPFGAVLVEVEAQEVRWRLEPRGGLVELRYRIALGGQRGLCALRIRVRERGQGGATRP